MAKQTKLKLPPDAKLVTIEEASAQLGKGFSRSSIIRRINSGEWEEGNHWFDARREGAVNRLIKINVTAVLDSLATPAAFR